MHRLIPAVFALAACARTLPPDRAAAALHRDLERMVTLTQAEGWDIDRVEIESLRGTALLSVCRTPPASREALAAWLDAEIAARGGPVAEAWRARGKKLSRVETLLELTRIRAVLADAMATAETDCPFWMEPSTGFDGRQIHDDRFVLSLESIGTGIVTQRGDEKPDLAGGGSGRLLVGWTFGSRLTLQTGLDVGATADFPRNAAGERGSLTLGADAVVPVVARWHLVNSFFQVEAGPFVHVIEDADTPEVGWHVAVAFGGYALRRRWLMPDVSFAVSYERAAGEDGREDLALVKIGVRVGIDILR